MKKFGLLGFPLTHSFSQKFFTDYFKTTNLNDHVYENFPMESIEKIRHLIENEKQLCGLNVTIPHKINILKYLDKTDSKAEEIGAVNTIKITRNGDAVFLEGYNTDETGFSMAIKPLLRSNHHRALILGNGGSSQTVQYVLKRLGISFFVVTRNPFAGNEISYKDLNENYIRAHQLIVNTTPLGMYPEINNLPEIPYEFISSDHLLFDLIYNPVETEFLKRGKEKGALISNGLTMLHHQAMESWKIWNA